MSVLTCPVCQGAMREVNREGVLIDVCTQCRGVWLDRGELEKLATYVEPPRAAPRDAPLREAPARDYEHRERRRDWDDDDDDDRRRYAEYRGDHKGHHKKSKLGRFLDFFD